MIGEILVGILALIIFGLIWYMVSRKPAEEFFKEKPEPWKAPIAPADPVYDTGPKIHTGIINSSTRSTPVMPAVKPTRKASSSARSSYPSGGSTTHIDTSSSDLLSTMLILDAIDNSDNYVEPTVDTYAAPSYSTPTPSSYSSSSGSSYSDDSSSSRSYSSSSSSWGDSSSSSSSSYDSGSSSSSSSYSD